ncbi:MAG: chemotaxis protein CheW [Rhizobiales bacterium]|nr:chemotaxis protein CheW [Hyphomicrobiales bacterium]
MHISDNEDVHEYVTAVVDRQLFGLPIARVQDVFVPARLTRVPLAPPEVAGVLNLRGRILTVIDLRRRLGLPVRANIASDRTIGIELAGEAYGLLVDSVGEVMRLSDAIRAVNPANLDPRLAGASAGVYRLEGELMILLDVDRVLHFDGATKAAGTAA